MERCGWRILAFRRRLLFPAVPDRTQNKGCRSRISGQHFFINRVAKMSDEEIKSYGEKGEKGPHRGTLGEHFHGHQLGTEPEVHDLVVGDQNDLHKALKGRHMQMIAM